MKNIDSTQLPPEAQARAAAFHAAIVALLDERRITALWRAHVCVVVEPNVKPRVCLRGELARELRADDLGRLAHEVLVRKVAPGQVLMLTITDNHTKCWPMRVAREHGQPESVAIIPNDRAILELLEAV